MHGATLKIVSWVKMCGLQFWIAFTCAALHIYLISEHYVTTCFAFDGL